MLTPQEKEQKLKIAISLIGAVDRPQDIPECAEKIWQWVIAEPSSREKKIAAFKSKTQSLK